MSSIWVAAVVIVGMAIGIVKAAIGEMVQEEVSTRLGRIPFALIRLACIQVPPELRDDLAAEWNAELEFLLTGTDGMPLTRLVRGIRYSAALLFSAHAITDGLTRGNASRDARLTRSAAVLLVASTAGFIYVVARAPADAWFTGSLRHLNPQQWEWLSGTLLAVLVVAGTFAAAGAFLLGWVHKGRALPGR
jgi:hypothetical protein